MDIIMIRKTRAAFIVLCILAVVSGCQGDEATPTKAVLFQEATPDVQATVDAAIKETRAAEATDTPQPTRTPQATMTPQTQCSAEEYILQINDWFEPWIAAWGESTDILATGKEPTYLQKKSIRQRLEAGLTGVREYDPPVCAMQAHQKLIHGMRLRNESIEAWWDGHVIESDLKSKLSSDAVAEWDWLLETGGKSGPYRPDEYLIQYLITGTATEASVTYENESGNTEQGHTRLPAYESLTVPPGQFVYISAQNRTNQGSIKCEIFQDGQLIEEAESWGAYVIAACRGSVREAGPITEKPSTPAPTRIPSASPEPAATGTPPSLGVPEGQKTAEIIQAHAFVDTYNTLHVIGVIENQDGTPWESVKVVAILTDAEGNFVDTDYTYTVHDIVWPGQKTPFSLLFDVPAADSIGQLSYDLTLEKETVNPADVTEISQGLEISDSAAKWDSGGYDYEIGGIVANKTDQPLEFVKIVAILYDTNGHIIGTDFSYTTLDIIPPDGQSPFKLYVSRYNIAPLDPEGNPADIGSYELTVEGKPVD